ncbi:MAG: CDP-glucose 4,6-dehydratase [Candidatus Margulisiibacteriota bacterium]
MLNKNFWKNKKIFLTGNTGFKGSWLSLWLTLWGAKVSGYALKPPTQPNLFELCYLNELVDSTLGDIRDLPKLKQVIRGARPDIVIHMAAQPLVRESYKNPIETFATNVMGTANVLEAMQGCGSVKAALIVTTDKCYENIGQRRGYKETDPLGGYDPYSSSKACAEIVTASYRQSFFQETHCYVASARAGNVIGGGDFAADRLVPDFVRSILRGETLLIRSPKSVRPWQHVLEPLSGYLLLLENLALKGAKYAEAYNFGPEKQDAKPVIWLAESLCKKWGKGANFEVAKGKHPHEAHFLHLDITKAKKQLGWSPRWDLDMALDKVVKWTAAYRAKANLREVCLAQIAEFLRS